MSIENLASKQDLMNWLRENITTIMPPGNVQAQIAAAVGGIVSPPPGVVAFTAASSAPGGWIAADGSAVSREDYAALFTAIGTTYGAGDGSTTFNVPDLQGRMPVGLGPDTHVDALGENEGLAAAFRHPQHSHGMNHKHLYVHHHGAGGLATGNNSASTAVADAPHQHAESGGGTTGNQNANETVAADPHNHNVSGTTGDSVPDTTDNPDSGVTDLGTPAYVTLLGVIKT